MQSGTQPPNKLEPQPGHEALRGDTQPAVSRPQKRPLPGSRYTDQEIERGLVALALFSGNRRRASKALDQQGLSISGLHSPGLARDAFRVVHRGSEEDDADS